MVVYGEVNGWKFQVISMGFKWLCNGTFIGWIFIWKSIDQMGACGG